MVSRKDPLDMCKQCGVIYEGGCEGCGKLYVGKIGKPLWRERERERERESGGTH